MWRSLFIGFVALAIAEETASNSAVNKRQSDRGNVVIYDSAPGHYLIQSPDGISAQSQNPSEYASQPELYQGTGSRKPQPAASPYSLPARRPQYVTAQQLAAYQRAAQIQASQQQQEPSYDGQPGLTRAGHGNFYKPTQRLQPQPQLQAQPQQVRPEPQSTPVQYASSAIVDSNVGSFEEELAQLVAANRAQEQKYNAAQTHSQAPTLASALKPAPRRPAPEQYLKEVTRPPTRPVARPVVRYQQPIQFQQQVPQQQATQSPPLYRYVYQPEQSHQLQQSQQVSASQQQYEQPQKPQYVQPQEYIRQQPQPQAQSIQSRPSQEDSLIRQLLSNPQAASYISKSLAPTINSQTDSPSRSQIYVSQSTTYKKPVAQTYSTSPSRDAEELSKQQPIPLVRIPAQRNKPLTQEEFQNILQLGSYTATLIPSSQNSAHQEYLLQPRYVQQSQRATYLPEQPEGVAYQVPQQPIKKRPQYSPSAA